MLLQVEYRFAFVLFLAAKTTEGAGNGVSLEKKALFGLGLILCFPVLFCVRGKLLAEVQTFCKKQDIVIFFATKCKQVQQLGGF